MDLVASIDKAIAYKRARGTAKFLRPHLPQRPGRVLNFGAGDCVLSELFSESFQAEVESVDVYDSNLTTAPLSVYDGRTLPYPDDSFDWVYAQYVLHHIADQAHALRELARVCRGRIILIEDRCERRIDEWRLRVLHAYLSVVLGDAFRFQHYRRWHEWIALAQSVGLELCSPARLDGPTPPKWVHPGTWLFLFRKHGRP